MHEALSALVDYAFKTLGLNRLEADIDPRNHASARTLERLGFQKEGHLRERWIVSGEISDTWWYGLLRRDWREHTSCGLTRTGGRARPIADSPAPGYTIATATGVRAGAAHRPQHLGSHAGGVGSRKGTCHSHRQAQQRTRSCARTA